MEINLSNGGILSPSVMCADLINLENDIEILKNNGVEYLHVDFMDNKFVSNITFGADTVRALKDVCGMHRDIHVMAQNPVQYFDKMDVGETDIVAVHYESCLENTENVLKDIHSRGALAFLAISPDTSVKTARKFFEHIDGVLLMSVYPGFAGRPMVPGSFERISELRKYIEKKKKKIALEIDGNVSWENAPIMRENGADMFVAGSSSIYQKNTDLSENIKRFLELVK